MRTPDSIGLGSGHHVVSRIFRVLTVLFTDPGAPIPVDLSRRPKETAEAVEMTFARHTQLKLGVNETSIR